MQIVPAGAGVLAALTLSAALVGCSGEAADEIPPPDAEVATPPAGILPTDPPVIDASPSPP